MKQVAFVILFLLISFNLKSQQNGNLRFKEIMITADSVKIDSLPVMWESLQVFNQNKEISSENFRINFKNSYIFITDTSIKKILIKYRVSDIKTDCIVGRNLISDSLRANNINIKNIKPENNETVGKINSDEIIKSGSISRGITAGNNQNTGINSDMNLQISGKLNSEYSVSAAVTDNNIPLQADGSTQTLKEFDKIFIKIFSDKNEITAGDFQVEGENGFFLKTSANVQGIKAKSNIKFADSALLNISASVAAAKGKFNRISFNGVEANQGPYRLTGISGEKYIFVISGSEKIYIDSQLLTRGADNDYVIDYNTAEITFTAKQFITKDSRIIAEFEYSDRNFTRYSNSVFLNYKHKSGNVFFNYYSESDSKKTANDEQHSQTEKNIIENAGDNTTNLFLQSAQIPEEYLTGINYYLIKDTSVNGIFYEDIFVYAPENISAIKYNVVFTETASGNGNYIKKYGAANGSVFEWIAPVNGNKQGNFEAVKRIYVPENKSIFTAGTNYISKQNYFSAETAVSFNDKNKLSSISDNDNTGFAFKTSFLRRVTNFGKSKAKISVSADATLENKNFSAFEPYKNPEYYRERNITESEKNEFQYLLKASIKADLGKNFKSDFSFEKFALKNVYDGNIQSVISSYKTKNQFAEIKLNYVKSDDTLHISDFLNYNFLFKQKIKKLSIGFTNSGENNMFFADSLPEILNEKSYKFNKFEPFVALDFNKRASAFIKYSLREDFNTFSSELKYFSKAENFVIEISDNNKLKVSVTYRNLKYLISGEKKTDKSAGGQISYKTFLFNKTISNSLFINMFTGVEPATEIIFVEIGNGAGTHAWKDFNLNGIKETGEFVEAVFSDEARYIKTSIITNNYINVFNSEISENMNFRLKRNAKSDKTIYRFISMFNETINLNISQKNIYNGLIFSDMFSDSLLVYNKSYFRNILGFSPKNKSFKAEYSLMQNNNKTLLITGTENKKIKTETFLILKNIKSLRLTSEYKFGTNFYESDFFSEDISNIKFSELSVGAAYRISQKSVFTLGYRYSEKNNMVGSEKLFLNEIEISYNLSFLNSGNINLAFKTVNINFDGNKNTAAAYEINEGLNSGNNAVWNINLSKKILENIQLNFFYGGRISSENKAVHNGGISLRAVF